MFVVFLHKWQKHYLMVKSFQYIFCRLTNWLIILAIIYWFWWHRQKQLKTFWHIVPEAFKFTGRSLQSLLWFSTVICNSSHDLFVLLIVFKMLKSSRMCMNPLCGLVCECAVHNVLYVSMMWSSWSKSMRQSVNHVPKTSSTFLFCVATGIILYKQYKKNLIKPSSSADT